MTINVTGLEIGDTFTARDGYRWKVLRLVEHEGYNDAVEAYCLGYYDSRIGVMPDRIGRTERFYALDTVFAWGDGSRIYVPESEAPTLRAVR